MLVLSERVYLTRPHCSFCSIHCTVCTKAIALREGQMKVHITSLRPHTATAGEH